MSNVCILTDSTVQFTQPKFRGRERVFIVPAELQNAPAPRDEFALHGQPCQRLLAPSPAEFINSYERLSRKYDTIFVLTVSTLLHATARNALSASVQFINHATIGVIDSQTTGVGLGLLVQAAAAQASAGSSPAEIERKVRASIPHVYMLFCIPQLTTLARAGFMDHGQALVGEMMGLLPIFSIEEGHLTPLEKVRTPRRLFESFMEFINEFESPAHIAVMCGSGSNMLRSRGLRKVVHETFPATTYSEHALTPSLAALFGNQSTGLVVMEKVA
jgi:DegV family protein with EDD domain